MAIFERIAVVGLGLLGGSLALAARRRGVARETVGATRSPEAQRLALESGAVDAVVDLADVGRDADLLVLATPVHAMPDVLRRLAPGLPEGALVTDVGSRTFSVPIGDDVGRSLDLLRRLQDNGISITDFQLRRPTLDDVFLSLTGSPAENEEVPA